jgi:hypothetical protein
LGTICENVRALERFSRHKFDLLNMHGLHPLGGSRIPGYVSLRNYRGIFIHCTLAYNPSVLDALDRLHGEKLAEFDGLKIVMKQDEHYRSSAIVQFLARIRADLLLTCLTAETVRAVYPSAALPNLKFLHTRTGYVTPEMRSLTCTQDDNRPIDIGYRASPQPFAFGRLCYEKRQIGEVFQKICSRRKLTCDISSRWEDRFLGADWLEFLSRSKATLGVESGGSVFDFTGEIGQRCTDYLRQNPEADFETVHRLFLAEHEGNVPYAQVSPRHFEAAACRTLQILYEGRYSDIFEPNRHFLALRRDLSNLDEVLARFGDPGERKRITETAFEEIVQNDKFSYAAFVGELDDAIDSLGIGAK